MSKPRPLTYYYPARKKPLQNPPNDKVSPETTDYTRFLECNNVKFSAPLNLGFTPSTPYRSSALSTWVYPGSKGFRKYQFLICRTCLFYNTLVCLPTGLGKTFIAATVMYNYYRWFKEGLVFFLAPTKPLVDQQYNAFTEIVVGFNERHVGQLTGKQSKKERRKLYGEARVFFMTPQTLANDLKNELLDKKKITCIIFDEAHRATGNYAYCKIIKELLAAQIAHRVVALSATPGPNIESIQQLITNLCIAKIEARTEDDEDVKLYTHYKDIEVVKVKKTDEITKLEELMVKVIAIPQGHLQKLHLLPFTKGNKPANKMVVLEAQEKFKREAGNFERIYGGSEVSMAYSSFSSLLSLLGGLGMLLTHGMDSLKLFCDKFKESAEEKKGRKTVVNTKEFKELMEYLEDINKANKNHPKLEKMKDLLVNFFKDPSHKSSQAIIFTLFVNSAQEICKYLEGEDEITPKIFIGQANGYTQKDQMRIINSFKAHTFNTLVATCIGEEGLDIGYVDIIISYDCTGSPVRMIQRFGRTGRQQEGKVVILLCDEEERRYHKMQKASKHIYEILKTSSNGKKRQKNVFSFYDLNPRMVEEGVTPTCIYATKKEDFVNPKVFDKSPTKEPREKSISEEKTECTSDARLIRASEIEETKEEQHVEVESVVEKVELSEDILAELLANSQLLDEEKKSEPELVCGEAFTEDLLELAVDLIPNEPDKRIRDKEEEMDAEKRFKYHI